MCAHEGLLYTRPLHPRAPCMVVRAAYRTDGLVRRMHWPSCYRAVERRPRSLMVVLLATLLQLMPAAEACATHVHHTMGCYNDSDWQAGAAGPVHTAIVRAVTEALEPVEVELVDDSASHAGHSGMKGRQAVEVRCPAGRVRVAPVSAHARVRACPGACQGTLRRAPPSTADERGLRACCWHSPTSSCGSSPRSLRACP